MTCRVAVAGAGIYGATIAIRLAGEGHSVDLFDPLGVLRAASAINQYRVHAGYHYPRSPETIAETLQSRGEFLGVYQDAVVRQGQHYYAIPREGSRTRPEVFEGVMRTSGLPLRLAQPLWMNFDFIDRCYEVEEQLYDPDRLRKILERRIEQSSIRFRKEEFSRIQRGDYDFAVWATYGMSASQGLFASASYQLAEKVLIELPLALRGVSLVLIDGPFTAFDPYGESEQSLFGSARYTNHAKADSPGDPAFAPYRNRLNQPTFEMVEDTRFQAMRADVALAVPSARQARYLGSRFTIRVVENNPEHDRRILSLLEPAPGELHVFSGKVVGAVKAATLVCERIARHE